MTSSPSALLGKGTLERYLFGFPQKQTPKTSVSAKKKILSFCAMPESRDEEKAAMMDRCIFKQVTTEAAGT